MSQDTDPNAPWLTLAHIICADAGIPPGPIIERLEVLSNKLDEWRKRPLNFCACCGERTKVGNIHTCAPPNIK